MSQRDSRNRMSDGSDERASSWDEDLEDWPSKPIGWKREWDLDRPEWEDVFDTVSSDGSRSNHPSRQKPKPRRGRNGGRSGWGSY